MVTAGLLAAQPGGWTGAPSGDGGAAVPDAWPPSGDAAFAGLLPGYAFAQSVVLSLTAADSITDTDALELRGAWGIATFTSGGSTYAAVTAYDDNGVQILDITDPSAITAAGNITGTGTPALDGAWGIATFTSGGSTYAAVTAYNDNGVQILDITDPYNVTAADSITNTATLVLRGARGITTFESGGSTYAAVAAYTDNGVQILNITDPYSVTAADSIGNTITRELDGARGITTFTSGGSTYAAVTGYVDDGVQILDVTDPSDITAAGGITNTDALLLDGALGIATFTSGGSTYAAVTAYNDNGVQILDITNPSAVTAAGSVATSDTLLLNSSRGIAVFESGGSTYAAVTVLSDDGVQMLDVTDPSDITAAGSITDDAALELLGASGIATFASGGSTYAAVAAYNDNGVQILRLTDPVFVQVQDSTPPTFVSSEFDGTALTITFSETIAAANVDPAKIHVRESGSYAGGITLTAGELDTTADADTISFALTESSLAAVKGLDTPELTIEPGAVRDTAGNPIVGTFDVSTATYIGAFDVRGSETSPRGMAFSSDGAKMFVVGSSGDAVHEYDLSAPFDVTDATHIDAFDVSGNETSPRGMAFSNDGAKMFVAGGRSTDYVHEYALTVPFDVSTATHAANVSVSTQDSLPEGVAFSSDGSRMFIAGDQKNGVYEYALGTPFDVTSYSFTAYFNVTGQDRTPEGVAFSNDGARMFVVGSNMGNVYEYALTAPFDVSTASPVDSFSVSEQDSTPTDMAFSSDGAKMFVVGNQNKKVYEYALSSVYPITVAANNPLAVDPAAFVTTWETTGASQTITIPVGGATGNYTVHWGDGNSTTHVTNATHAYAEAGNHTVSISGDFTRIWLGGDITNAAKLKSIDQWGSIAWTTMREAFRGASSMVYNATDAPDLSGVTSMQNMFRDAAEFDGDLSGWNVSGVADMDGTFRGAWAFDGDLSAWDTSGSTDMQKMFQEAISFNGDLSAWDVSGVKNMESMFANARDFNGDISGWNTSSVETMQRMFPRTAAFNADISGWDVSGVTDMQGMFAHAGSFHQTLSDWDVSNVTDMEDMFLHTQSFNGDISTWNVSSATTMGDMFNGAVAFNGDISGWNVSAVTNMGGMFDGASSFDQNLGEWYVVLDSTEIDASGAPGTVGTISAQNSILAGQATYGIGMGGDSTSFNITGGSDLNMNISSPAKSLYTVNVTSAGSFGTGNHRILNVTVTDTNAAPVLDPIADQEVEELQPLAFTATASDDDAGDTLVFSLAGTVPVGASIDENTGAFSWIPAADQSGTHVITVQVSDGSKTASQAVTVTVTDSATAFVTTWQTAGSGEDITIPAAGSYVIDWGDGTVESVSGTQTHTYATAGTYRVSIAGGLESISLGQNTTANAAKLQSIEQWGNIAWTTMEGAFHGASSMVYNAADAPDLSGVTSMQNMFRDAAKFDGDLSGWDVSGVASMDGTFRGASAFDGDISGWDVSRVTRMNNMFTNTADFNGDISGWNVSSVTDMSDMFFLAEAFNGDISGWNVSSVTNMNSMFRFASIFNGDISGWNVSSVTDMSNMLEFAHDFRQNLGNWYIVLNSTEIDAADAPGVVGTVSAQNSILAGQATYGIGDGGDSTSFNITGGSDLNMNITSPAKSPYTVNITASGGFGTNNHRVYNVTVTGLDADAPTITIQGANPLNFTAGIAYSDPGAACVDVADPDLTLSADDSNVDTQAAGTYQVTYTCTDSSANAATATRTVHVTPVPGGSFVTTWQTASANDMITIPVGDVTGNYTVHWGDGSIDTHTSDAEHAYASAGSYKVSISGEFTRIQLGSGLTNSKKLVSLDQWGDIGWTSMDGAFWSASNMIYNAPDAPNLSDVSSMRDMFRGTTSFNGNISAWNVSSVTDMSLMFWGASAFNGDMSSWNVSGVTTMNQMFSDATSFNGTISDWDVSGVNNMNGMFSDATSFNGDLSAWNVSGVTTMANMFDGASAFNGDISAWDVSSVGLMNSMFDGASAFNGNISGWNVSGVSFMLSMFDGADSFDQNLGNWYIVPAETLYDNATETSLNVTAIAAQNQYLVTAHAPEYGIGMGGDSTLFSMNGSTLAFKSAPTAAQGYTVNVTADSSGTIFGTGNHRILNVTVTDTNAAPVLDPIADQEVEELQPLAFTATASDDDAGDTLVFSLAGTVPVGASIDPDTGAFSWTPGADQGGTHVITVRVSDGKATDSEDVTVTVADSATAFVTTWQVAAGGSVTIPATGTYGIHWGDGVADAAVTGTQTHTYDDAGTYAVAVTGGLEGISLGQNTTANAAKLQSIGQWGDIGWTTMEGAFQGASNMVYGAADAPDLSGVTNMTGMFGGATAFDGNLSSWDVSGVTDMANMFESAENFDGDISSWNVSSVTNMDSMFSSASVFNGDITAWNVSSVTDMGFMFLFASAFDQDISDWDVSNVTDMEDLYFLFFNSFSHNLGKWHITLDSTSIDLASGTTTVGTLSPQNSWFANDGGTYGIAGTHDHEFFEIVDGTKLSVKADAEYAGRTDYAVSITSTYQYGQNNHRVYNVTVTDSSATFVTTWEVETSPYVIHMPVEIRSGATAAIDWGDGSTTDVGANGTQQHAYADAGNYTVAVTGGLGRINLNGSPSADKLASLDQWGDMEWTTMEGAFRGASSMVYNATDAPDLSGATSMQNMFRGAEKFDGDLSGWDVSGVANMDGTFRGARAFDGDLSAWDTSGANDTRKMFESASSFNGDISSWNTSGVTHMNSMFQLASSFNGDISSWNTSSVTKMQGMFYVAEQFNGNLSGWNVSAVTDMHEMFTEAISFNGDITSWDVSSVTDMFQMFSGAAAFNQDISGWNVSGVINMEDMFLDATAFNQNLGNWYVVLNSTEIDAGDAPGVVGTISAQNTILAGQATYGIGTGGDSTSFNITGGSNLNMNITSPAKSLYVVNITSAGGFGDNNHRAYNVTVTRFDTNSLPMVGAGADQEVAEGDTVALSGTVTDVDTGDILTYSWTHDSDLPIAITGSDSLSASFVAPNVAENTTVTVTLTVNDGTVDVSDALQVNITDSLNSQPRVEAGADQEVVEGATAALSGTVSDDDPEDDLTYSWTHDGALTIAITGSGSASASFVAPSVAEDTTITVTLTVNDGTVDVSDALQVTITDSPGLNLTAADSIDGTALELDGARGIATFESGGSTYAAVAAHWDDGVQILDVTNPFSITAAGDIDGTALELDGAEGIAVFESGGSTYAAVAAYEDDGVQILDITDPSSVTAAGNIDGTALELDGAWGIAVFESGGSTYAAVAAFLDDGVQILDITNPYNVTAAGSITEPPGNVMNDDALELNGARGIAVFESGGGTYAAVAAFWDDGVQILNITDPYSVTAADNIDGDALELDGAEGITIFTSGGSTYAAVAAYEDDGVQILDVTDPSDITAAGDIDGTALELEGARGIATFAAGGSTYAAVASSEDNGVQILDITDPSAITAADNIDGGALELEGARGIAVFESGGSTYAAVASSVDDGVQILRLAGDGSRVAFNSPPTVEAGPDQTVGEGDTVTLSGTVTDDNLGDALTYEWTHDGPSGITLANPAALSTSFTAPSVVGNTTFTVTLTVNDETADVPDTLQVTITDSPGLNLPAAGSIGGTALELNGAQGIATFESGGSTYAAVASREDDGVQILDITDPSSVTAADNIDINDGTALELLGASDIAVFESDGGTYAAVASFVDDGVQILNITDPSAVTAAGNIDGTDLELDGARGIAVFESGGSTYAAVTAYLGQGVQILDITDPYNVTAADKIGGTALELHGASGIAVFESGGSTYAAVASFVDRGVQILNITDPSDITAAGSIDWGGSLVLRGAEDIAVFESGGGTYAAVAAYQDDAVQILDMTDPYNVTAAGSITDTVALELRGARGIATFESGGSTYAAVAAYEDDGVQMLDITDPYNVTAAGDIDGTALELEGARGIAVFESGGSTYAAVAAFLDDGVQIIRLTGPVTNALPPKDAFVTTWEVETSPYVIHMPVEIRSGATATIDWGDGSTADVGASGTQTHTYAGAGNYTVAVTGGLGRINLGESASADKLASLDQWGDMEWTTMEGAFSGAYNMAYRATDAPDLSGVTNMTGMFSGASAFDGNLSGWDVSGVTDMANMFQYASAFDGNVSGWDVSGVTDMAGMFSGASAFDGNVSGWGVSGVTDMANMFGSASAFNGNVSGWNVSGVTDMYGMFWGAEKFDSDLSGWNVSGVTDMANMFQSASDFNGNVSGWNVSGVTDMANMFWGAEKFNGTSPAGTSRA